MNEEEKEAIEYLKTRLYGNEGCKYIDVAQEDLRIFINLIDRLQNKKCKPEFDMEKLQKENEQFLQIKNKYKQSWLDDMDVDFLINSIEKLQCENRALKEGNAEAWEEWNNLEQGSYQTEQNLKKQLEKLRIENDKLRVIRHETKYGMETTYLIPKERLIEINTNKYIVEIENGKFVDLKEVYQENEELKRKNKTLEELLQGNLYELYKYYKELADTYQGNCIPVQKVKDKIEELNQYYKKEIHPSLYQWADITITEHYDEMIELLQELLEEGGENG